MHMIKIGSVYLGKVCSLLFSQLPVFTAWMCSQSVSVCFSVFDVCAFYWVSDFNIVLWMKIGHIKWSHVTATLNILLRYSKQFRLKMLNDDTSLIGLRKLFHCVCANVFRVCMCVPVGSKLRITPRYANTYLAVLLYSCLCLTYTISDGRHNIETHFCIHPHVYSVWAHQPLNALHCIFTSLHFLYLAPSTNYM